jgi:DNA-binding XRE family transcriptional regulator
MPKAKPIWSWVGEKESERPIANGPGRYSRPLAVRDKVIAQAFGQEVRRLRIKAELSTRELGRIVGLSQPWIVRLETKPGANIELRLMWDFAEAFGVEVEHFLLVCHGAVAHARSSHDAHRNAK